MPTFHQSPVKVFILWFGQCWIFVKQIGHKGKVEFGVSTDDVIRCDKLSTAEPVGLLQHGLGPLQVVLLLSNTQTTASDQTHSAAATTRWRHSAARADSKYLRWSLPCWCLCVADLHLCLVARFDSGGGNMPLSPGKPFKTKTRLDQNPEKTKKQFRYKITPPTEIVNDETVVWTNPGAWWLTHRHLFFCGSVVLSSQQFLVFVFPEKAVLVERYW